MMKLRILFLAALVLSLFVCGCGDERKTDKVLRPLTLVTSASFPPYEFLSGQQVVGIDVDIVKAVAERLKRDVVVIDTKFDSVIGHIVTGKADVAASGITVTEERKKKVLFTIPYSRSAQIILVPRNSPIKNAGDLKKKKRLGCQGGTTAYDYLRNHIITDKNSPLLQQFDNPAVAVEALKIGKLDAVILDEEPARVLAKLNEKSIMPLPEPLTSEEYAIALHKNNRELCGIFNAVIQELKISGELQKIVEHNTLLAKQVKEEKKYTGVTAFFHRLAADFHTNFIADSRWLYIWGGFWKTVQISFFAVILGTLLGFTVAVIRTTHDRTGKMKFLNALCRLYLTVIRGTPCVVQLLIIYFVILKSCDNKVLVACIAFGINSGAYVAEIIRSGIMSIDKGQFEAGDALGLSYWQTMGYVILPQALKNVLPALGNEFIVLIKETSVSGYIALQDLTKAGDIIRSQTYDAFMPLMAVAAIYLGCVMLLTWLLGIFERRLKRNE
ncbi:MAG: ABC transporter permease subunit, partial [Lentisphaeria bacterium]|nr:ABC transporter permease subunit [Lentisphaeria bacterium]